LVKIPRFASSSPDADGDGRGVPPVCRAEYTFTGEWQLPRVDLAIVRLQNYGQCYCGGDK